MQINDLIIQEPEIFLEGIGIDQSDCVYKGDEIRSICPLHEGADNPSGFCLYLDNAQWKCYTRGCSDDGSGCADLVMKKFSVDFYKAKQMIFSWYGATEEKTSSMVVKTHDLVSIKRNREKRQQEIICPFSEKIKESFQYDNKFFTNLGFQEKTIKHFYIGKCEKPKKPMSNRAFSLILDQDKKNIIGLTGRWMDESRPDYIPKWKHYKVQTAQTLYNGWNLKNFNSVIITEGPKEVWKLYEYGIENAAATLGTNLSYQHIKNLISLGVETIYLCYDNDEAGREKAKVNVEKYKSFINIHDITEKLPENIDIDELEKSDLLERFESII